MSYPHEVDIRKSIIRRSARNHYEQSKGEGNTSKENWNYIPTDSQTARHCFRLMLLLARMIPAIKTQVWELMGILYSPLSGSQDYGGHDVKAHLFLDRTP